jgi:membrane-associated phospholipid phosphatase
MVSRLVAQPVYPQLQKSPYGPALTLRANGGSPVQQQLAWLQAVDIITSAFATIFISGPDAMNSLTMAIAGLDRDILLTLNSFAGGNTHLWELANNSLLRGFPLFFSVPALWFSDGQERRGRMLAGLLAVCLATILSVWLQFHIDVHTRPILDPTLHLETVIPLWTWDRTSSFPSDTATLFFGLAAVVFAEERLVGVFCFVWVAVIIAIPRIIFGFHYASDIIGSLVLGPACVFIFVRSPYPRRMFERTLMLFEGRMYIVHALLFVFLAEASNLFLSLEALGKQLVRLLH